MTAPSTPTTAGPQGHSLGGNDVSQGKGKVQIRQVLDIVKLLQSHVSETDHKPKSFPRPAQVVSAPLNHT